MKNLSSTIMRNIQLGSCPKCGADQHPINGPRMIEDGASLDNATRIAGYRVVCLGCGFGAVTNSPTRELAANRWYNQVVAEKLHQRELYAESLVWRLRHVDKLPWRRIAEAMHYSQRHCLRIHGRANEALDELLGR